MGELVNRAVIPAAGLGTRMFPITKTIPKEMLPVGRKPMIQLAVEELATSGIRRICIVLRRGKETIREYLLKYPYSSRQDKSITELKELVASLDISFLFQKEPTGLGSALLAAADFVGEHPFIMLIPDQLVYATVPATTQLLQHHTPNPLAVWSSLVQLPKEDVPYFIGSCGFEFEKISQCQVKIKNVLSDEQTSLFYKDAQFEIRGIGRTILPPSILDYLAEEEVKPETGEIDYRRAVGRYSESHPHYGVLLEGKPFDLGTFEGYYRYLPRIWDLIKENR